MPEKQFGVKVTINGDATGMIQATKRLGQSLKTVGDLFTQFGRRATVALTGLNAAFIGSAVLGARLGDEVTKTAFRLDITTEALRELTFAAEQSGADITALRTGMRRLSASAFDAARGLEESEEAFRVLKVQVKDSRGQLKSQETLFKEVTSALGRLENKTIRQATAQKLLGRSGDLLAPLFAAMAHNSEGFGQILVLLNAQLDKTTGKLGEDVVDAFGLVKKSIEGVQFALLRALGPAIEKTLIQVSVLIAFLSKWIDSNAKVVDSTGKVVFAANAAAGVFTALVAAVGGLGAGFSALATAMAGPATLIAFTKFGIAAGAVTLLIWEMARASEAARVTTLTLIGAFGLMGVSLAIMTQRWRVALAAAGAVATAAGIEFVVRKIQTALESFDAEVAKVTAIVNDLKKEFENLGQSAEIGAQGVDKLTQFMEALRDAIAAPGLQRIGEAAKGLIELGDLDAGGLAAVRQSIKNALDVIEQEGIKRIGLVKLVLADSLDTLFLIPSRLADTISGADITVEDTPIKRFEEGIRKVFKLLDEVTPRESLALVQFAKQVQEMNPELAQAAINVAGISNEIQLVAVEALVKFTNIKQRVKELLDIVVDLGDAVGNFLVGLLEGTDKLAELQKTLRIQQLKADISDTTEEQEKWTTAIEKTQRRMNRLELAALQNKNAWNDFFQSAIAWVRKLITEVISLIAKMFILRALASAFGPIGNLFGQGFFKVAGATGATGGNLNLIDSPVGGVPDFDTASAIPGSGAFTVPTGVTNVTISAGMFLGTKAEAAKMAQFISRAQDFNETGVDF